MYQQNKSPESKVKLRHASDYCKRVLDAAKLTYANKKKASITSHKRGSQVFYRIANSVRNKGKSPISLLFNSSEFFFSCISEIKTAKNFAKNCNLYDSGISLPDFPRENNLKPHKTSVTPKKVKKAITSLKGHKASGPDC